MKELTHRTKAVLNNQQGFAVTLLFLIVLPVIFFALISTLEITNVIQAGDMDLQEGMVLAVKASAEQVDMGLHSQGIFQISPDRAANTYRKILACNMGLDESLSPLTEQYSSTPRYCLLVYNGTNAGPTANKKYKFNGTTTTSSGFIQTGFPQSFMINGLDVVVGAGDNSITLTEPGVIVVTEIDQKDLLVDSSRTLTRWAAARIKTKF